MRRSPDVEHERKVAIFDLLEENSFTPKGSDGGPYLLHIAIEESRLVFDIRLEGGTEHGKIMLSLTPFRKIIKDYFLIRSEEHTSELQSLMRIPYAVFCLKKK